MGKNTRLVGAIQGFAPNRIVTANTSLDVTDVLAVRISVSTNYTIDGVGTAAEMPAAAPTVIAPDVTSIDFAATTVVEVMDN